MQHVNVIKAAVGQDLGGGGSEAVVVFVEDDEAALAVAIVHEFRRRLVLRGGGRMGWWAGAGAGAWGLGHQGPSRNVMRVDGSGGCVCACV